jgi:hypothetical protein
MFPHRDIEAKEKDNHLKIISTGSDCVSAERGKGRWEWKGGMLGWEVYCV